MSLETVVEDIREQARARADEIRAAAESEAEAIIDEAEADAEETIAAAERQVDRDIEQERDQRLSSANLEAKQNRLEARRDLLESVRQDVEERIAGLDGDRRQELTNALLDAAAVEFEDDDEVSVYGRAEDEALLSDLLDDYDGFEFAGEYDCLGGVVVESSTSRLRVNNTFDSILDDVWESELKEISNRLFEQ
jgi:V/A-type H+-transporting ATPase subunit E